MEIIRFPHKSLFIKCKDITVFGPELLVLLKSMAVAMDKAKGMGLAANQVDLHFNMFVMEGPSENLFIVNPKIIKESEYPANIKEGCLSAPGEFLLVPKRKQWVAIQYQDETGAKKDKVFEGIYAVCVQHEMEHLQGKGFMEDADIPRRLKKTLARKWGFKVK